MSNINKHIMQLHGDYTIIKKRNGIIIQEENFHNLFTKAFFGRISYYLNNHFAYCYLGSGSTVPASTDTLLSSPLWAVQYSTARLESTSADNLTRTWEYIYIFPANRSYEGTIREVGLFSRVTSQHEEMNTHALVVDSEGQPIEIEKTYIDEITITAKISLTRPSWQSGQTWAFDGGPLCNQVLIGLFNLSNSHGTSGVVTMTAQWCPEYRPIKYCVPDTLNGPYYNNNFAWSASAEASNEAKTYPYSSTTGIVYEDYINSLVFGSSQRITSSASVPGAWGIPSYRLLLPNSTVFPITTLEGLPLGTGDGSTVDFAPALPAWLADTEVVYNNGVALTPGIDYQVDNLANLLKFQSVMIGNFVAEINAELVARQQAFIFGAYETNGTNWDNENYYSPVVRKNSPIIYTYAASYAFSDKFNYFILGSWTASENIAAGAALVFYYSTDNESTWIEFARINHATANNAFNDTSEHTLATTVEGLTHIKIALEDTDSDAYVRHSNYDSRIGYVGAYAIRFLTPPAEGDILTIDLDIDRPWKSHENDITWNPILNFGA